MVFTLASQMYLRISVLVPVPEYLPTSTSTITLELTSTSKVRVPEIQYSSTASTSTEYEYPSPDDGLLYWRIHMSLCLDESINPETVLRKPWCRHEMRTFSALLALCEGNPPVTGGFPSQRPVTWSFYGFWWWLLWSAPEQTVEQTIKMLVIRDTVAIIITSL